MTRLHQLMTQQEKLSKNIYIIAEAACEHRGSMSAAKRLIDAAKDTGADCIKFQLHVPDAEMIADHPKMHFWAGRMIDVLREINFETVEQHLEIKQYCKKVGIEYLATPFCIEAADRLEQVGIDVYKIGSGELTNLPMLKHIAQKGLPMIISTGMSHWNEIEEAVLVLHEANVKFAIMNCTSEYPTPPAHVNLRLIPQLIERYHVLVGQSDHTTDIYTSIAAVAIGARVIEKHLTIRDLQGPDDLVSLDPNQFKEMVRGIRQVEQALGDTKELYPDEEITREWAHHSIVAATDIPKGVLIQREMLAIKRPSGGVPPSKLDTLIGKHTLKHIGVNSQITFDDVD